MFFYAEHNVNIATATARLMPDGTGKIHMVGTHAACTGKNSAYSVVRAAMQSLIDLGVKTVALSTDDFRLPAIRTYTALGFKPFYEPDDQEMIDRWTAVFEKINAFRKPDRTPIPLWPDRDAPFTGECGDQAQPSLTPFVAEGSRGAVIVCPGGGYSIKASHEGAPVARMLALAGISAFVLDYRVQPFPSLDTPIADALRAVRLVRSMGYEKVAILGFSAGGHLAGMAASFYDAGNPDSPDPVERLSSRPDAFVSCYGATSLYEFRLSPWSRQLLGDKGTDAGTLVHYSAESHVTDDTPPAFIWQTSDDPVVPVTCALSLAKALTAHGVPHEMHLFPHGPHGIGLAGNYPDASQWAGLCQKWLLDSGFGAKQ